MAAADKQFSSAVLALADTFCRLMGLCMGSSISSGYWKTGICCFNEVPLDLAIMGTWLLKTAGFRARSAG
jgi:hypothetical protein